MILTKPSADIILEDGLTPEDIAMVQALYSRDPRSARVHIEQVKKIGSGKFMGQYYVGYGHKSIGDCGTTTIFIEGCSMLGAKAIQDWLLYNGQEASTRYLDFSAQNILNPHGSKEGEEIQAKWMRMYNIAIEHFNSELPKRYPIKEGDDEKSYEKAIKARAFDIARAFLPAGMTTLVSWHTNLRQAEDHLKRMRHHPLEEVRQIAESIHSALMAKYPNSFKHKRYGDEEEYLAMSQAEVAYTRLPHTDFKYTSHLKPDKLARYMKILEMRPAKAELPFQMRECGDIDFEFSIDFASYRDAQRQRSMIAPQPLLTTDWGFHPWYLNQMSELVQLGAKMEIASQLNSLNQIIMDKYQKQYYVAMGFQVPLAVTATLPAATYVAELRAGTTVHPTLRPIAQKIGLALKELVPTMAIHCDMSEDSFTVKRGTQDIVKK